ncbi:MAG: hypothetical protein R2748_27470 [Bryobacterales bacterium]
MPERPRPRPTSVAEVVQAAEVELALPVLPAQNRTDLAWEFEAPDPDAIPFPGIPALSDLEADSPALPVAAGLPTNMPDIGQQRVLTPALSELADAPSIGKLGEEGYGKLWRPPAAAT